MSEGIENNGKGVDRKGTKADGLRLNWKWDRVCDNTWTPDSKESKDKRRLPSQCCFAEVGDFKYEVTLWHTHYQATVRHNGNQIISFDKSLDDRTEYKGECLLHRLQAQLKAEQLLVEYLEILENHLDKYGFIAIEN